jgi:hypothetical protein
VVAIPLLALGAAVPAQEASATLKPRRFDKWPFVTPTPVAELVDSAMCGAIEGVQIKLIDTNANGRFDEVGKDALVVGDRPAAAYLGEIVNLRGKLYRAKVAEDGTQIDLKAYEGDVGKLSLRGGFRSRGNLDLAVVASEDGKAFFELSRVAALEVPAGNYHLVAGVARRGGESVRIGKGKMTPITVPAGASESRTWGTPLIAEFNYTRHGEDVTVEPDVHFYGSMGEEYFAFEPDEKSPKFLVLDKKSRRLIASGRFGGC